MKQVKLLAQHRSAAMAVALAVLILGLAFFAAPHASLAQDMDAAGPDAGTVPPIPGLQPSITFIHAAPIDSNVDFTGVDVCTEDNEVVTGFENIRYGEARTLFFDPNPFDWKVARAGSNCLDVLVDIERFGLGYSAVRILVLAGDDENQPLEVIDVLAREGGGVIFIPVVANAAVLGS